METEHKVNLKYKDTFFRYLFGSKDRKQNALDLFNVLNGTDYKDPDELELTTIDDIVYMNHKNDVSVLLCSTLNLWEHQSTWNPNMPLRGLIYLAELYDQYISTRNMNVYSRKQLHLPTPRYFVLYNGDDNKDNFDRTVLRLEDSFENPEESCLTLKADVININFGENREILEKCKPLYGYSFFAHKIRENQKHGMSIQEAADKAVDYCIENDILKDVLTKHKAEVIGMCITEYNEAKTLDATYLEGRDDEHDLILQNVTTSLLKNGLCKTVKEAEDMAKNLINGNTIKPLK